MKRKMNNVREKRKDRRTQKRKKNHPTNNRQENEKNTDSTTEKDRDKVFEEVKNIKTITRNTRQRTKLVKMKHED